MVSNALLPFVNRGYA